MSGRLYMHNNQQLALFKKIIWEYYAAHGRLFEWRHVDDPYKILVSEIMLQQTQTQRVAQKYPQFISVFPDFQALSCASLKGVLSQWQGLGYNRRGMYLHKMAQRVSSEFGGVLPNCPEILENFDGIGPNTARSVCAFAFNMPVVFIETNIRTVFIHFFFQGTTSVHDRDLMPLIEATLDKKSPRDWYYALMDYGVMLKKTIPNPSRKSAHHAKQSKFEGSDRQIRGAILRMLTSAQDSLDKKVLYKALEKEEARVEKILTELISEGFIQEKDSILQIL